MHLFKILAIFVACLCSQSVGAADTGKLEGEWTGFELEGYGGWDNGNCIMLWFSERKYDLHAVNGSMTEMQGTYARRRHGRFLRNMGGECKHPSQPKPMGLFANTKLWNVNLRMQSDTRATVTAKFDTCFDSGCEDPNVVGDKSDWNATLDWVSGTELQDSATSPSKRFFRKTVSTAVTSEAIAGLDQILRLIAKGEYSTVSDRYLSSLHSGRAVPAGARNGLIASFPVLRPHLNNVSSRDLIEARSAYLFTFQDSRTVLGTFAFIMREVVFNGDARTMEVATLHKENGAWHLLDYGLL